VCADTGGKFQLLAWAFCTAAAIIQGLIFIHSPAYQSSFGCIFGGSGWPWQTNHHLKAFLWCFSSGSWSLAPSTSSSVSTSWTEWLVCSVILFSMRRHLILTGRGSRCGCFDRVGLSIESLDVLHNAATAGLEYKSAFQGMAHLALSLQYVLQWAFSPSAVPEHFYKHRPLSLLSLTTQFSITYSAPKEKSKTSNFGNF